MDIRIMEYMKAIEGGGQHIKSCRKGTYLSVCPEPEPSQA